METRVRHVFRRTSAKYCLIVFLLRLKIQKENPPLTYQAKGYDTPNRDKWSDKNLIEFKEVEDILKGHIIGFSSLQNFVISKEGEIGLRLQYNYGADDNTRSFTGVGYIKIKELLNGFE